MREILEILRDTLSSLCESWEPSGSGEVQARVISSFSLCKHMIYYTQSEKRADLYIFAHASPLDSRVVYVNDVKRRASCVMSMSRLHPTSRLYDLSPVPKVGIHSRYKTKGVLTWRITKLTQAHYYSFIQYWLSLWLCYPNEPKILTSTDNHSTSCYSTECQMALAANSQCRLVGTYRFFRQKVKWLLSRCRETSVLLKKPETFYTNVSFIIFINLFIVLWVRGQCRCRDGTRDTRGR